MTETLQITINFVRDDPTKVRNEIHDFTKDITNIISLINSESYKENFEYVHPVAEVKVTE